MPRPFRIFARHQEVAPRFGLRADVTSGDDDPNDPDLQTFNPLFPKGTYFGEASLIGPLNHMDLHPSVGLRLSERLDATLDWDLFWRESRSDGLYRVSGTPQVPGAGSRARSVGSQASLTMEYELERHTTLTAAYAHFFAGAFLEESGVGRDVDFLALWLAYRI